MEEQNTKKYYVGIDLGTNSCGWAVTDKNYKLMRLKGKDAFGARLFSQASSSKQRRTKRTSRRRMARRKFRIQLLNSLLGPAVEKVDSDFLIRLQYSALDKEDKKKYSGRDIKSYPLFPTKQKEVEFYKKYPTIWHLRLARIKGNPDAFSDIRYVYLALHHIIKYRGNFLWEGKMNPQDDSQMDVVLNDLNKVIEDLCSTEGEDSDDAIEIAQISPDKYKDFYKILENHEGKVAQQKAIKALANPQDDIQKKYWDLFAKSVTGGKFSPLEQDEDDKTSYDFAHFDDEKLAECQDKMGEAFSIIEKSKQIYDFFVLKSFIKERKDGDPLSISSSMVFAYQQHHDDLLAAKHALHAIDKKLGTYNATDSLYYKFFKDPKGEHNYPAYVGVDSIATKKRSGNKTNEELIKTFNNLIKENTDVIAKEDWEILNAHINNTNKDDNTFRPRIAHLSTSVIPHQLHENELDSILTQASNYYPEVFTSERKSKIKAIFKYRIPFYFGPLYGDKHSNVIRKDPNNHERITPFNIDDIVNKEETRKKFMNSLTNSCAYLFGETVRPKSSLDYEEYIILDRLNKIQVNGHELTGDEKKEVLDYILGRGKTTKANLVHHLAIVRNRKLDDIRVSKMDGKLPFTATSHAYFKKAGYDLVKDHDRIENVILLSTIYAENKSELKEAIKNNYSEFTDKQIKQLAAFKTNKWGRLSRKFLTNFHPVDKDGVVNDGSNILEIRRTTNQNLNEILFNPEYNFQELIKQSNDGYFDKTNKNKVDDILDNVPAVFRRSCNQCLLILKEIKNAAKGAPEKIFFEVTREDLKQKDKKRKDSRKDQIKAIYKQLKDLTSEFSQIDLGELNKQLNAEQITDDKLRGKHLYLYFRQLGRDAYTGKPIKLEEVLNGTKYDTDHIIPKSLIKDDSLDNLVLVNREDNQNTKSDIYPIPSQIKTGFVLKFWHYLHEKKMRSDKKYNNLRRNTRLTEKEIHEFVNSQINAVNYSNKALKDLVEEIYPNTKVVFSKAQYPSERRKEYHRAKLRELNNAHHARDAYLNIVCGDILSTEFSDIRTIYARKKRELEQKRKDPNHSKDDKGEKTFNMVATLKRHRGYNDGALAKQCQEVYNKHSALITYALDYADPSFYNEKITSPKKKGDKANKLIPIHTKEGSPYLDTTKYGGYDSSGTCYRYLVSYSEQKGKKNKKALKFLNVKNYRIAESKSDEELLRKQLVTINELTNVKDLKFLAKVYNSQKVKYENCVFVLSTNTFDRFSAYNAYEIYLDGEFVENKTIETYAEYLKNSKKYLFYLPSDATKSSLQIKVNRFSEDEKSPKAHILTFSKEKNLTLFNTIRSIANTKSKSGKSVFEHYFTSKLKDFSEEEFKAKDLKNQSAILLARISVFQDSSDDSILTYYPKFKMDIRKSLNISEPITLIYDSVTGLYSKSKTYKV